MVVLLEELVRSLELWLRLAKETAQEEVVDLNLDPVLLVPGIGGSILEAVDETTGEKERVWVRILAADHEFRTKLWSLFDPSTGTDFSIFEFLELLLK